MEDMHCFSFVMIYGLSSNNVQELISVFIPCFIGLALGKMEQKYAKNEGISRLYK